MPLSAEAPHLFETLKLKDIKAILAQLLLPIDVFLPSVGIRVGAKVWTLGVGGH